MGRKVEQEEWGNEGRRGGSKRKSGGEVGRMKVEEEKAGGRVGEEWGE